MMASDVPNQGNDEKALLGQIKKILLNDDREKLDNIERTLEKPELLEQKMRPVLQDQLQYVKDHFPQEFGAIVDDAIEAKLEDSKEQLLDVIYPVLGQMIKKYINQQFQLLKDRIDNQMRSTFSKQGMFRLFKARLMGVNSSDIILQDVDKAQINQIYIVMQDSGLLAGEYTVTPVADQDIMVGMLTAIKSFAQDTFGANPEALDMINYEQGYKIMLHNFNNYYAAIIINGSFGAYEKDKLVDKLLEFAQLEMNIDLSVIDTPTHEHVSKKLETYFKDFDISPIN